MPVGRAADAATAPKRCGVVALACICNWFARATRRSGNREPRGEPRARSHRYDFEVRGYARSSDRALHLLLARLGADLDQGLLGGAVASSNAMPVCCPRPRCFATAPAACASTSTTGLRAIPRALARRRRSRRRRSRARRASAVGVADQCTGMRFRAPFETVRDLVRRRLTADSPGYP